MTEEETKQQRPRRIIRRRRRDPEEPVVDPILLHKVLQESSLPHAYTFEIPKTIERINHLKATHIALQMPEGLLMYATVLGDILKRLASTLQDVSVLGDVTYGACCVDDLGAKALGCQLLVHYGHSCLVPLQHTVVPCLYVFVEIQFDIKHLVACLQATLAETTPHVYLLGTIQFRHGFPEALQLLKDQGYTVSIPQAKPLSPGEVLGCTSPVLEKADSCVCFVADGRFHLESTLISNPHVKSFYRYDPYSKTLTTESYDHERMKEIRSKSIARAREATTFGVILGTLGRQGNPAIVKRIRQVLKQHEKQSFVMLLSEITPAKLQLFKIDAWVQVACPRLSVDWGHYMDKPLLSPYELFVCMEETEWREVYPMDFYSTAGGPWANYYEENKDRELECKCKD
jgi:2-(3-amino-3-carboxypropyl)histidine synthase